MLLETDFQYLKGPAKPTPGPAKKNPMTPGVFSPLDASLSSLGPTDTAGPPREARAAAPLATMRAGEPGHVIEVGLEAEFAGWLEAMGIGLGQTLTVLRRAAFGGPIHVRVGSGGEFAVDAALARCILVSPGAPRGRTP
jgi:Fe2+ transport system protein FeoA